MDFLVSFCWYMTPKRVRLLALLVLQRTPELQRVLKAMRPEVQISHHLLARAKR